MVTRPAIFAALALLLLAPSQGQAQSHSWQTKWYWGVHGSVLSYETAMTTSRKFAVGGGAHWLITGKRSALYVGFDQYYTPDSVTAAIADVSVASGVREVDFTQTRRIQALLYAIPSDNALQIMLGGGFSINQVTNAIPQGPFATTQEAVNAADLTAEADTRAFVVFSGGVQYRMGKLAVFSHYQYMPSSSFYLLFGEQHALSAGIRYALSSAHEDVTTSR